jgi:PGF-CTERM protein
MSTRTAALILASVALLAALAAAQNFTVAPVTGGVSLAGPQGSVVRGNPFVTTVTGDPVTGYYIRVKGTSSMSGSPGDQPPVLVAGQEGVAQDPPGGPYTIGSRQVAGGGTIRGDVPPAPGGGTGYYALVTTDAGGTRAVKWETSQDTGLTSYDIRVEGGTGSNVVYDDTEVTVIQGALSLGVNRQVMSAYLGEEIDLAGTNTESDTTYLFITGPNLPPSGGRLDRPRTPVVDGDSSSFTRVTVNTDGTWRYRWQTGGIGIDAGIYTIFAVSSPVDFTGLGGTAYGITSVDLSAPPAAGPAGIPVVDQGDSFRISGVAAGASKVAIWIFGENLFMYSTATPNADGTFAYTLDRGTTSSLAPGQYVAVIQHPGPDETFEVSPGPDRTEVILNIPSPGSAIRIGGLGAPQAANALITALDSPYIDDTYTTLTFLVQVPRVTIGPVGQVPAGTVLRITGTTNLAPGDHLMVTVTSSLFGPTTKGQGGQFYGASGSVAVQPGPGGVNTWSFSTDTSAFAPGQYLVLVSGVDVQASASTSFTLVPVMQVPVTAIPTRVTPTPATPVPASTPAPTPAPTPVPGFGALLALAGATGVSLFMRRRRG